MASLSKEITNENIIITDVLKWDCHSGKKIFYIKKDLKENNMYVQYGLLQQKVWECEMLHSAIYSCNRLPAKKATWAYISLYLVRRVEREAGTNMK